MLRYYNTRRWRSRKTRACSRLRTQQGIGQPQPDQEEASTYRYNEREQARRVTNRNRVVLGAARAVCERMQAIAQQFSADKLIAHEHAQRVLVMCR